MILKRLSELVVFNYVIQFSVLAYKVIAYVMP
jgi:hypothetical protein